MARLDLEWLAVFDEIYNTGSVSKAAERLGLAQAVASTMLNKLRVHFGDRLFARTAQGMQPTPFAQKIRPNLREALAQLEQARGQSNFEPAKARRNFRICMTDISEVVLLPTLLDYLQREAPGVQIETEIVSTASGRRLEDGEVDLAVASCRSWRQASINKRSFRRISCAWPRASIRASATPSHARISRRRRMR